MNGGMKHGNIKISSYAIEIALETCQWQRLSETTFVSQISPRIAVTDTISVNKSHNLARTARWNPIWQALPL